MSGRLSLSLSLSLSPLSLFSLSRSLSLSLCLCSLLSPLSLSLCLCSLLSPLSLSLSLFLSQLSLSLSALSLSAQDNIEARKEHAQAGEAQQPRATKVPHIPTEEERLQRELIQQPFRPRRELCQRSRARPAYHKGAQKDRESVIQVDYSFLEDPHLPADHPQQRLLTIPTTLETTTGLANAVLTHRKGDATHQRQQIKTGDYKRFRKEHTTNRF